MRKTSILLMFIAAIGAAIWFYISPDWEPAITFISLVAAIIGALNYNKEGLVSFSVPQFKIKGGHFQSGRIMAGSITCELDVSNKTNSAITISSASISISEPLERSIGKIPLSASIKAISGNLGSSQHSITVEPNTFITLRVQADFKCFDIEKFNQAKAIGRLAEKELCFVEIQYKTIHASKKHHIEIEFETSDLKHEVKSKYKENKDFEAVVNFLEA